MREHSRQIYGPLDLLGDVGGLADALLKIGATLIYLMQLAFGNPIDQHLQARIFEKDNSSKIVSS